MKVIQSIQRAINILNCFDQNNLVLSLNEISQKLDLNINTTRGLVNSLVVNNFD
ncbi:IclR helix-turn-helix domain [Fusobacterium necrophorum subsp. necrophorum]|nr:IclR helix-turn-helix domain [Fusobacterium necrophorum subsp. necrophorum]